MKEKLKREWITPERRHLSWWRQALEQLRLTWSLLLDSRMPLLYKLIPLITLAYIISPLDFIPDVFVGVGMLDDIGILMLGVTLFNSLAPGAVALEHLYRLRGGKDEDNAIITRDETGEMTEEEPLQDSDRRSASKHI